MADLAELARRAGEAGIFLDFDGTLSDIVPDPADARLVPGATVTLRRLAARYRVVAVISGRAVRDLAARVRVRGVRLVGLHGMESLHEGAVIVAPAAAAAASAVDDAAAWLRDGLRGVRGVVVEHKGLALAVHTRRAFDPDEAERIATPLVAAAARDHGLEVVPGRRLLELRPPAAGDKGGVVRSLVRGHALRVALAAGDDTGDIPVFAALSGLEVAVRVAVSSAEAPPGLLEAADLVVSSPGEVVALLRRLGV